MKRVKELNKKKTMNKHYKVDEVTIRPSNIGNS